MDVLTKPLTIEEFDELVDLPENADRLLEFIGGEIVEVPSNPVASEYAFTIGFFIKLYLYQHGLKGHITGEAGGYMVMGERYAPDVAYLSIDRQTDLVEKGYNPIPPDLAVEVEFPTTEKSLRKLRTKVVNYLMAGTTVWVILPESQEVEVYSPGQAVKLINRDGLLDGGDVLLGFALPVKDIFPPKP